MAESDHRGGDRPVTSTTKDTAPEGAAPDEAAQVAPVPVRSAPVKSAPVRSAPLRRRKSGKKAASAAATPAAESDADVAADEPTGGDSTDVEATAPEKATVDLTKRAWSADTTTDPDDLSAGLSYRERRRRRTAAQPAEPAPVAKVSALRRRSDRSVVYLVAMSLSVLVIVGCLVASAVFTIAYGRVQHQRDLRAEYSSFAQQMTVTMTSLNPGNVDAAMKTMTDRTSGAAQQRLKDSMAQAVSLIRDQNLDVKSTVISDAVTKATDDEGTVILVYGWQMKPENPQEETIVQTFRWKIDITRINGELKMTSFEWVT
ncbi:hypothetical protein ABLE94_25030 [Gordonia sp. VNK1]|uniref:hypothetical protein n=1 Tax=Gordonia oleivorans TaxID=3156618 RepID=UPI0032B31854